MGHLKNPGCRGLPEIHDDQKNRTFDKNRGATWKFWTSMISKKKNSTFENSGVPNAPEIHENREYGTFDKNMGTRTFWKIVISREDGTSKTSGRTIEVIRMCRFGVI